MTTRFSKAILLAATAALFFPCAVLMAADAPAVSLQSLLEEMVDREAVARWPAPAFACKQASSHDRRKTDPSNPETWHSNTDHGQFLRTEVNEGRKEWVIMDDTGPGAVVRFWAPLLADKEQQVIRFYFDGSPTPAITAKFNELLCGQGFVRPPLAFVAWNETDLRAQRKPDFKAPRGVAGDLYLPIPFAKGCKITLDSVPFYYVINYRIYDSGTKVETFTMVAYEGVKATVDRIGDLLCRAPSRPASEPGKQTTLAPGENLPIDLKAGPAAIVELRVAIDPRDAPQVLRSIVLEASFDDEATVWCPIGEFFGAGTRLNPVADWWRTVDGDGSMAARWTMPYERAARVSLKNVGDKPATVTLGAATASWSWDDRSLHFRANWRCQLAVKTRPISDWNYLEVAGQGRYVGDTLSVYSPARQWYGEGDERIYVDGAAFPAHIGTGTEDYYGYAWGMAGFFSSPFLSQPQRDGTDRGDWRGYTTTSRVRPLDSIPFRTALKLDMEIWNWADTQVDYAVGTFWYARPGAKHNRSPQPNEAAQPVHQPPAEFRIAGAVECEKARIVGKSDGLKIDTQNAGLRHGEWSAGQQLFIQATKPGEFIELEIPSSGDQPRQLAVYATKSYDYGILRFTVNGQPAGDNYDAYQAEPAASGPISVGTFAPKDGKLQLRVEVVGANPASRGPRYYFGLDCVVAK